MTLHTRVVRPFLTLLFSHPFDTTTTTTGIEVSTGPLGQGLSNAVGLAMAERNLAATFNKDNFDIIDHFTYVICGDGCLQEGVTSEACSLAGHLGLGRIICLYDDNKITIVSDRKKKEFCRN